MGIIEAVDKAVLLPATTLGGGSAVRDRLVFFLADILPWLMVGVGLWIFFSGKTKVQKEQNQEEILIALAAVLIAVGIRWLIGEAFDRPRPFLTYPEIHHLSLVSPGSVSFPSSHAFLLFTYSGVIYFIGNHRKVGILLLALSAIVVMARVVAGVHYPSDVVAGAVLGLGLAKLLSLQSKWVGEQMR